MKQEIKEARNLNVDDYYHIWDIPKSDGWSLCGVHVIDRGEQLTTADIGEVEICPTCVAMFEAMK